MSVKAKRQIVHLPLTIERNDDGYLASCPLVEGAFAEGDTIEEAVFNCLDVIKMIFLISFTKQEEATDGQKR